MQQSLLAKAFGELGFEVFLVDKDYGQNACEYIGNIRVLKTYTETSGIPVIRFFYPRLTSIWRALQVADSDVYYQSCAGMLTGVVAFFCKRMGRRFVFRTAHDTDCVPDKQLVHLWRDRKLYDYGLRNANIIAVQGIRQQDLLARYYRLNGVPVNMVVEIPVENDNAPNKTVDVLWVNNMRPFKRPDRFIELAKALPDYRFTMIGGPCPGHEAYYEHIMQAAQTLSNLVFIGPVPYRDVNQYFSAAKVFVNTSETEGFPNSFLQAWVRCIPVVSFFDPDNLISSNHIGYSPSSMDEMVEAVVNLIKNDGRRKDMGRRAKAFAIDRYSPMNVASHYVKLINRSFGT